MAQPGVARFRKRPRQPGRALLAAILATVGGAPILRAQGEEHGAIGVLNSAGRSGAYYIPAGPRARALPLLVLLHATGGSGQGAIPLFRSLAQTRSFAIVAPDSRRAPGGELTWEVGDHPGEVTPDLGHVLECIRWVREHAGLTIDPSHVLIAGYSGGGRVLPTSAAVGRRSRTSRFCTAVCSPEA